MIIDRIDHWRGYSAAPAWARAFGFLTTVTPLIDDGTRSIVGTDVEARIMSYRTKERAAAVLEAHREYVDIQVMLAGTESIEWFPAAGLTVATPYDPARDAELYVPPAHGAARFMLEPGMFAVFFPTDAHLTQIMVGPAPALVRKVVIKVRAALLAP